LSSPRTHFGLDDGDLLDRMRVRAARNGARVQGVYDSQLPVRIRITTELSDLERAVQVVLRLRPLLRLAGFEVRTQAFDFRAGKGHVESVCGGETKGTAW
jgi:hypothetical protein